MCLLKSTSHPTITYVKIFKECNEGERYKLRKVYKVKQHEQHVNFYIDQIVELKPAKEVIADSDTMSFIYIVEENDQYSYLAFEQQTWESLIPFIQSGKNPTVSVGEKELELIDFSEEFQSLVFNIEGNSNYGEQFVEIVEETFAIILRNSI